MTRLVDRLSSFFGKPARPERKPDHRFRPRIDALEERRLMAVFIVDDDFAGDNPAARMYDTIQEAVDAAATPIGTRAGDIIVVRPGIYDENVVVDKRLTLMGSFAPSLPFIGSNPNPYDPAVNPNVAAIIDPTTAGAAITVTASGAIVQGFTLANFEGTADSQGVVVTETTGVRIMRNVILDQTIGVSLDTSDASTNTGALKQTWVYGNTFRDNNTAGAAAGNGIYADAGIRNVLISANKFTGHENASIIIISDATTTVNTNVTISANQIGDQFAGLNDSAIILANLRNSTVSSNILRNIYNNGTGIFFAGGSSNVTVVGNNLQNGAFTGINVRYLPGDYFVAAPNTRLFIQGNIVSNFGDGGIRLRDGSFENIVRYNVVYGNGFGATAADVGDGFGSGITLEGAIDNIVDGNTSYNNDADGFFADEFSLDNVLRNNLAYGNGEHDYHDDSTSLINPTRPANTYFYNRGRTQNRTGLIRYFV